MKQNEATRLWRQLFDTTDRMRDAANDSYELFLANLTFNQLRMIKFVHTLTRDFPDGVTLKMLAEALHITPAAASEMVDALVRKEVLKRDHNPQDRRAIAIRLADLAMARLREREREFDRLTAAFLNSLPVDRREVFLGVTDEFTEWMRNELP